MSRPPTTGSSDEPRDPKTEPAYPSVGSFSRGLTQYAEVAARFHAACIPLYPGDPSQCASEGFHHADAFFFELARRTQS